HAHDLDPETVGKAGQKRQRWRFSGQFKCFGTETFELYGGGGGKSCDVARFDCSWGDKCRDVAAFGAYINGCQGSKSDTMSLLGPGGRRG
ncbi:TPA: hypothetical protein ACKQAH_004423, partial [Stenotrophomonas maltophilia]